MKLFMRFFAVATVVLTAMLAPSCSPDTDELLSTVPADSKAVAVVNVRSLADKLGVKFTDSSLTLPEAWKQPLRRLTDADLQATARLAGAIDITDIVVFGDLDSSPVVTFRIDDESALDDLLKGWTKEKKSGFTCRQRGRDALLTRGSQGWFLSVADPAATLRSILDRAASKETGSIASVEAVRESLDTDGPVRFAVALGAVGADDSGRWAVGDVVPDTQVLGINAQLIDRDGRNVTLRGVSPLSNDFLRYTPANCNFAAAMGANADTDWSQIAGFLSMIPDAQISGMLGTVMPYLEKADGTVALAASVNVDDPGASGATFLAMIHMPQADVDAALAEIERRMTEMGATPTRTRDGQIALPGLYAGNVDGYLAVSSMPLSPDRGTDDLNPYFLNRNAAIVLRLPGLPIPGLQQGTTVVSMNLQTEKIEARLATPVPLTDFIGSLLGMVI